MTILISLKRTRLRKRVVVVIRSFRMKTESSAVLRRLQERNQNQKKPLNPKISLVCPLVKIDSKLWVRNL